MSEKESNKSLFNIDPEKGHIYVGSHQLFLDNTFFVSKTFIETIIGKFSEYFDSWAASNVQQKSDLLRSSNDNLRSSQSSSPLPSSPLSSSSSSGSLSQSVSFLHSLSLSFSHSLILSFSHFLISSFSQPTKRRKRTTKTTNQRDRERRREKERQRRDPELQNRQRVPLLRLLPSPHRHRMEGKEKEDQRYRRPLSPLKTNSVLSPGFLILKKFWSMRSSTFLIPISSRCEPTV